MKKHIALTVFICMGSSMAGACEKYIESAFEVNQKKWHGINWNNYSYIVQRHCFCPPEYRYVTRVTVQNGEVVGAKFVEEENKAVSPQVLAELYTIQDWFGVIRDASDANAVRLEVSYHKEYGYPEKIDIDMRERMVDDEQTILISEVIKE